MNSPLQILNLFRAFRVFRGKIAFLKLIVQVAFFVRVIYSSRTYRKFNRESVLNTSTLCFCGSGIEYTQCCGLFHSGETKPLTAVALMRSRFTAYALQDAGYLLDTWDATARPELIDFSSNTVDWQRLEISKTIKGAANDTKGIVEFKAYYLEDGEECMMNEISRFIKQAGTWFYLDGRVKAIGRMSL